MSKGKYIDVELENCVHNSRCVIPEPENIIFLAHWFDTNYEYKSEDMGHFYEIAYIDGEKVSAEIHGNTATVRLKGIKAKDLDVMHTFKVVNEATNESYSVQYSALSYAYQVLDSHQSQALSDLAKALYLYNDKANTYFEGE